jgi:hypothetical protein
MVKGQHDRDENILGLVRTMDELYDFVTLADDLKKNKKLQDVVERIWKQTIECAFFIKEYVEHKFGG